MQQHWEEMLIAYSVYVKPWAEDLALLDPRMNKYRFWKEVQKAAVLNTHEYGE
jgi:hypothetical protein